MNLSFEIFRLYNFHKSREPRLSHRFRRNCQIHLHISHRDEIKSRKVTCDHFFSKSNIRSVLKNSSETLWHGTGEKYVASIDQQGLIPKGRLYVHLSSDAATATKVGSRHGKPVLYIVKTKDMYDDGYSFFLSKNGVWLTKEVPVKYLIKEEQ